MTLMLVPAEAPPARLGPRSRHGERPTPVLSSRATLTEPRDQIAARARRRQIVVLAVSVPHSTDVRVEAEQAKRVAHVSVSQRHQVRRAPLIDAQTVPSTRLGAVMGASGEPRTGDLRVLFVCTANIARSPYAYLRAAALLRGQAVTVASAGIPGVPGRPMDQEMAAQLSARGGDPSGHVSRSLTGEILDQSDLVITVEFAQRMRILDAWPDAAPRVFGLHQLVDALGRTPAGLAGEQLVQAASMTSAPDSMTWDVRDPHRRGRKAARVCADEIDEALAAIVPALAG